MGTTTETGNLDVTTPSVANMRPAYVDGLAPRGTLRVAVTAADPPAGMVTEAGENVIAFSIDLLIVSSRIPAERVTVMLFVEVFTITSLTLAFSPVRALVFQNGSFSALIHNLRSRAFS
jgi:ABC-type amino acid transport substrate-binding protein